MLGKLLTQVRNALSTQSCELTNRPKYRPSGKRIQQAVALLDKVRSDMENEMFKENPGDWSTHTGPARERRLNVYYGDHRMDQSS